MKTKQQINLDRIVLGPLARLLNIVVRIVGKILKIDHSLDKNFKTIVVCKFKGMGSIIQSTPMLKVLRQKYPESEIIFVSTNANKSILEQISLVDKILTINDSSFYKLFLTTIKAIVFLIKKKPEVYIDLEIYSNFSTIFTTLTLSKNRIGFFLRSSSYKMGIYTHMMYFNPNKAISDVYLQIAVLLCRTQQKPELYNLYKKKLDSLNSVNQPYIIINVNASDLREERKWDKDNYIKLISHITNKHTELKIILIGSKNEFDYTESIKTNFCNQQNVINYAGKTNVQELISLIANAACLVTNDTGPMHIAFSCKTPTVCLFGPCSPQQYGYIEKTSIIYKNVYCSPCVHEFIIPPCKGNNTCMKSIFVDEVIEAFEMILNKKYTSMFNFVHTTLFQYHGDVLGSVKR